MAVCDVRPLVHALRLELELEIVNRGKPAAEAASRRSSLSSMVGLSLTTPLDLIRSLFVATADGM